MEQGSADWYYARAAKITASGMVNVLAKGKRDGRPLKARQDYLTQIVVETLTGEPQDAVTPFVQTEHGNDVEPYARAAYEAHRGVIAREVGFVTHPKFPFVGCSPDGQVLESGEVVSGCEIKCPYKSAIHLETLLGGMPEAHIPQVQTSIWVHEVDHWDFVSYDPRFPDGMRLYVERIDRDEKYIQTLESECLAFWEEVQAAVKELETRMVA